MKKLMDQKFSTEKQGLEQDKVVELKIIHWSHRLLMNGMDQEKLTLNEWWDEEYDSDAFLMILKKMKIIPIY